MQVEILPAAPLPGGVKVARRFVKPKSVGASPTLAANFQGVMSAADDPVRSREGACARPPGCKSRHPDHFWKAGRYKLAAPVSKTGSASAEVGALPTPSAIWPSAMTTRYLNPNERKTMFKPVNRSQSQLLPRRSYKPSPERTRGERVETSARPRSQRANRNIRIRFAPGPNLLFRPVRTGPVTKLYECNTT